MRAHLFSGALGGARIAVDIVTSSHEGVRFLTSMGRGSRGADRPSSTAAEARWVQAFVDLVRAARPAASGRRTLVAHPRPAF